MHEILGLEAGVGDKFRQEVQILWNAKVREIENDDRLMDLLNDANYNSDGSLNQTSMHYSEDEISNEENRVEDEVPNENNGVGDKLPNDSGDENDGLSNVNKDDIAEEEVLLRLSVLTVRWFLDLLHRHVGVHEKRQVAFLKAMDKIQQTFLEAHAYLSNISLETWAVHAFDSECKSEHNTNNAVEAFNGWMTKRRTLPMLIMMETVRRKFMKQIQDRKEAAMHWESNIPPTINQKLQKAQQKKIYLDPIHYREYEF
ncbi:hypothetical protein Ddye_016546 [Dipteronia dyeriana]|uniref:Uncharacterized protein n=1 Tax=Dipteronia dyeriana TaxID=168575 RepID=A0AAD9U734_9ROSI|nr:hypothetical protein Ddye_016546 [Dipteronia dyeriana]